LGRICIDGYNLALKHGTGIATYGRNLLASVRAAGFSTQVLFGPDAPVNSDNLVNEANLAGAPLPLRKATRSDKIRQYFRVRTSTWGRAAHGVTPTGEVIWPQSFDASQFWMAQKLFKDAKRCQSLFGRPIPVHFEASDMGEPPDVMHWTTPLPLFARKIPNIYTIHDLIPLRLPHATLNDRASFMSLHRHAVQRADQIAVVSEATRQDVIRILGVAEDRVTNTYQTFHLPDFVYRSKEEVAQELIGTFNLEWKNYFLHFGAVEPKKNLGRIVEAFLASGVRCPLVVVGGRGWLGEDELALLHQFRRESGANAQQIQFYEYMSHRMLISLIRGAKATIFPSLYEGFGLPVLESMALSTAVLTSTGGSLPEVAEDAGIIVDPYDVHAIGRGLQALDSDEGLRHHLERQGVVQAAKFSPTAYEARLCELYAKVGL
jgi:glycosyltransferase involved in cell wall biosynthesis